MFTTNLSIIIITGTGAGHEPQNKSPRPEELSSTVLWLGLNPHTDWSAHRIGATRMVFLQPTTGAIQPAQGRGLSRSMEPIDEQESSSPSGAVEFYPGGGFFIHRRTTEASSEKGMDSARSHHLHPSSRLLFGRSVSSLSASQVASLPPVGQLTKREVNRLHRRGRDEKSETECVEYLRPDPFRIDEKHCRVLGLNRNRYHQ